MIIDVHVHAGFSARRVDPAAKRFSFEPDGSAARSGYDSFFSPRIMARWDRIFRWRAVQRGMRVNWTVGPGDALDADIDVFNERHMLGARGVDRVVLLAFDEYYRDDGAVVGPASPPTWAARLGLTRAERGGDLYASNSLTRQLCRRHPHKLLFGASLHPYRRINGRPAHAALDELKAAGAVLVKWLPIHHNIRPSDPRVVAFLSRAAELKLAMLIHHGGEFTLGGNHPEFEHPGELLSVLRELRRAGRMPTTIVAHVATPTLFIQQADGFRALAAALTGEFRDAPLYADISGMATPGRAGWLTRLTRRADIQRKLVWGSDFPVPCFPICFAARVGMLGRRRLSELSRIDSWIERDLELKRAIGFDEDVFHRAGTLLELPG